MKSDFLKKIIAATVITTSIGTLVPASVLAVDFYAWQNASIESSGYWQQSGDQWYFYDYSGILKTGWIYDKGLLYYSDTNGVMQTGVIQVEGNIYLFSTNGVMQTGNAVVDGKYYTFNENGIAVGENVPTPVKAFGKLGEPTVPFTPDQVERNEDSSPDTPNTTARDPQNLVKYTVRFRDDDGDDLRTKSIEKDQEVSLYTPTKKGYKFVEWNTKEDGDGTSYDADEKLTVDRDISLYAQWEEVSSDSGSTGTSSGDRVLAEEIQISSSSSTIAAKGGTLQMSAKVLPIDASNKSVIWSVEKGTGNATISSSGLLTASENGTVMVVATAADGSKVTSKYNVTISGQANSGTTPGTGGNTGGNTGGSTTTGGKITAFDPNVRLADVVISSKGNIVDLPLLKTSKKLPTTAKITCSLSDGTTKEIEIPIKDWTNGSPAFDGTKVGTYELTATLGALPTGYTTSVTPLPTPKVKVIITSTGIQTNNRVKISKPTKVAGKILDTDKHIVTTSALNASGILPSKVTLTDDNGKTVEGNVKSWANADNSNFDGSKKEIKTLIATVDVPAGYELIGQVSTTLDVRAIQTANIQSLVEVVNPATSGFTLNYAINDKLNLNNLRIKVKYNNGSQGEISYDKFADNGITTPGYFNGYPLSSSNTFRIPIALNGNIGLYTESISVGQAASPTVKAADSSKTTYDGSAGITTNYPIEYTYTLGTGAFKASAVKDVYVDSMKLVLNSDYSIDSINKKITLTTNGLKKCFDSLALRSPAVKTPFTSDIIVEFAQSSGTTKATPYTGIHFIESKLAAPTGITLADATLAAEKVTAKNDTIKVKGLLPNVKYEYSVTDSTANTSGWTLFTSTTTEQELTNTLFKDGNKLNIRIAQNSDGRGAINPPSDALKITILSANIGVTKSGENTITSFILSDTVNSKDYIGTITQPTSATDKGKISFVVPNETNVSTLVANYVLSETNPAKVTVTMTGSLSTTATYTVKAENGDQKTYEVVVTKPVLQKTKMRTDGFTYDVTTKDATTGKDVVTKQSTTFVTEYGITGIDVNNTVDGSLNINTKFTTLTDSNKIDAFNRIQQYTLRSIDMDPNYAYVGMVFNQNSSSMGAVKVKIADTLEGLKTATAISFTKDINSIDGYYMEQIPVARFGGGTWIPFTQLKNKKYYEWINSNNQVIGYSLLEIEVQ